MPARIPRLAAALSLACAGLHAASLRADAISPDPLASADGRAIRTVADWDTLRRPELLELFRQHVYGRVPASAADAVATLAIEREDQGARAPAFDCSALRRRAQIRYEGPGGAGAIRATMYSPAHDKPKGCVVLIVNRSRRIIDDAETSPREFWPVREIVARGYATVAFHYGDIATDKPEACFESGVFQAFDPKETPRAPDAWGAVAAWAWGASRVVDYVKSEPDLAGVPVVVAGHSRGGKTALWCAAQDTRVALAIGNDSGTAGAAMARVSTGETIARINTVFPHWFALNYRAFNDRPETLPIDQHLLVSLIAPRLAYVASASEDANADPRAEFASCLGAWPVYALHDLRGVAPATFPAPGESRHDGSIGYHLRHGEHDLRLADWTEFLNFADARLK